MQRRRHHTGRGRSSSTQRAWQNELLEARTLFAAAPPTLGPELVLPGDTAAALSVGSQTNPVLSEGPGGVSLAVWQDTRSGGNPNVPFGVGLGTMTDIYAARVRADGSVIDVTPIPVSIASYNQTAPKAAWNGTNWLIAWDSPRDNDPYETDINAVRLSPEGVVLDQQPIVIGTHAPDPNASNDIDPSGPLAVVSDGADWVVTYQRHNPSTAGGIGMDWFAVKVLGNGSVPNQQGVKTLAADQYSSSYGLTFSPVNGGQYLHTYGVNGQVYTRRYDRNLAAVGGVATVTQPYMGRVNVAGGPNGWLMAWEYNLASWQKVQARRIGATGAFTDAAPIDLSPDEYGADISVKAAWNGVDWSVAYSGYGQDYTAVGGQDVWVRRLDPVATGAAALKGGWVDATPIDNHQTQPQLVSTGDGGVKLVYVNQQTAKPGISIALVTSNDQVMNAADVSLAAPSQAGSRLASDGQNFLMVFGSSTAYGTRLLGQRVTPQGAAIDAEPFVIADAAAKPGGYEVVYLDGRYVAIYSATDGTPGATQRYIYGRPVATNGTLGAPVQLVTVSNGVGFNLSDAAVNGDRLIVVGNSNEGSLQRSSRFARIFDAALSPVTARFQVDFGFALSGDTEPVNGGWISAWATKSTHDAPRASVVYARIALDGTITTPTTGIASSYPNNGAPTVVSNGGEAATEAMVVYVQNRDAVTPQINDADAIRAQRVGADGTKIGGQVTLIDEVGIQSQPAAIFDGSEYWLTWTDQRNYQFPQQGRDDIFAARVAVDGSVIDPGGFPVADDFRPETHGDVGVAGGQVMFAYNTFKHEAPWGSYRLAARGTSAPAGVLLAGSDGTFEFDRRQAADFTFNKPLIGADTADLVIKNLTTGQTIPASKLHVETIPAGTEGWTYCWVYTGGILPNGYYQATLPAGAVTDMAGRATTRAYVANFFALAGDANHDGAVNYDDYVRIDLGFNNKSNGYSNGDFNYDGVINFDDYVIIDTAFNSGQTSLAAAKPSRGVIAGAAGRR